MIAQIKQILLPTDFSEPVKQARNYAVTLADKFGSELHLMHVVPPVTFPMPEAGSSWTLPEVDQTTQVEEARNRLLQELDSVWASRHKIVQIAKIGYAVEEIIRYAREEEIDLIVMGTHGYSGLTHLLLGSVAEKVVRLATCPVLTVHPKGHQFVIDQPYQIAGVKSN